jgi:hypothetical protein
LSFGISSQFAGESRKSCSRLNWLLFKPAAGLKLTRILVRPEGSPIGRWRPFPLIIVLMDVTLDKRKNYH